MMKLTLEPKEVPRGAVIVGVLISVLLEISLGLLINKGHLVRDHLLSRELLVDRFLCEVL